MPTLQDKIEFLRHYQAGRKTIDDWKKEQDDATDIFTGDDDPLLQACIRCIEPDGILNYKKFTDYELWELGQRLQFKETGKREEIYQPPHVFK
jgi:hypothetical protein